MEEISVVSGAGDLYDSPITPQGNLLVYPDDIYSKPGGPIYEVWQETTAD